MGKRRKIYIDVLPQRKGKKKVLIADDAEYGWVEILEEIKNIDFFENVPVLFLTGVTEKNEIRRACEEGVADYVTKPFGYVELRKRRELVLKGYRMKIYEL
jgi:DNA-binding response OmpR family regulator